MPAIQIRRPSERDREPHGQYGVDAIKEVNLVTRNKISTRSGRTFRRRFIQKVGNGQLRTIIVQIDSILTETKVVE